MWSAIVAFLIAVQVCHGAGSNVPNPIKLFTAENVAELVNAFAAYRDNKDLEKFATAVGEMTLLDKKRADDGFNFVNLYLAGKNERLFDAIRKTFLFCSEEGNEHLMEQLKEFLQNGSNAEAVEKLFHCLPYVPDFRKEETNLVDVLGECLAAKNESWRLWISYPSILDSRDYWYRKGAREGKKYYLAMLKYELIAAPHEKRGELLKRAAECFGMDDLLELKRFLAKQFVADYSIGDIDKLVLGSRNISYLDEIEYLVARLSSLLFKPQMGPFNNLPFDIWRLVLLNIDWRTLIYSMPYINKAIHKYITESHILSECPDFQKLLRTIPEKRSPEFLFMFERPWNTIFPAFTRFLSHYLLNFNSKSSLNGIISCLQVNESDYDWLLSRFPFSTGQHPSGFAIDHLALMFDLVVTTKSTDLISVFDRIPNQLTVLVMGKVKNSRIITDFFESRKSDSVLLMFYEAVLRADALDWPENMIEAVENKLNKIYHVQASLPFTSEKIQKLAPEQLLRITEMFRDPLLLIKIFSALLEVDSYSMSIFTIETFKLILDDGLARNPKAMTTEQFGMFVRWGIKMFGDGDKFQTSLSQFFSKITEHK